MGRQLLIDDWEGNSCLQMKDDFESQKSFRSNVL